MLPKFDMLSVYYHKIWFTLHFCWWPLLRDGEKIAISKVVGVLQREKSKGHIESPGIRFEWNTPTPKNSRLCQFRNVKRQKLRSKDQKKLTIFMQIHSWTGKNTMKPFRFETVKKGTSPFKNIEKHETLHFVFFGAIGTGISGLSLCHFLAHLWSRAATEIWCRFLDKQYI